MPVTCGTLSLTRVEDLTVIQNEFDQAKVDTSVTALAFHAIEFNKTIISLLVNLLQYVGNEEQKQQQQQQQIQQRHRIWEDVTFVNCTGRTELLASQLCEGSALGTIIIQNLGVVRNLERFDNTSFLSTLLPTMASLQCLRLSMIIETSDATHLADGLANSNTSIESIDFHWTTFEEKYYDTCVSELARGLASNGSLKTIDFSACNLTDVQMSTICRALMGHSTLETLILKSNNCGPLAGQQLAALLESESCRLRKLDLSFQQRELNINKKLECQPIVHALRTNQSLRILDLTCNLLDDGDAEDIGCVLKENSSLGEIFLARNKFTDVGIKKIAQQFIYMKRLQKISLWGNKITEDGAFAILEGVKINTELHTVNLFQNFNVSNVSNSTLSPFLNIPHRPWSFCHRFYIIEQCSKEIQYFTTLNRGGRKLIQENPNDVPMSLWPLVIERANVVKLVTRKEDLCDEATRRADIIYYLLRGHIFLALKR
jgi:Ran GTPase-activating protein (RanGAP) involved in mRNA processing and transport